MTDAYSTEPAMIDIEMRLKTCDESDEYPYMLEATDGCLILYLDDTLMPVTFQELLLHSRLRTVSYSNNYNNTCYTYYNAKHCKERSHFI